MYFMIGYKPQIRITRYLEKPGAGGARQKRQRLCFAFSDVPQQFGYFFGIFFPGTLFYPAAHIYAMGLNLFDGLLYVGRGYAAG